MADTFFTSIVAILTAIVGIAMIAVLVSKNSATAEVIAAGGSAFAENLKIVVSPVMMPSYGVNNSGSNPGNGFNLSSLTGGANILGSAGGFLSGFADGFLGSFFA